MVSFSFMRGFLSKNQALLSRALYNESFISEIKPDWIQIRSFFNVYIVYNSCVNVQHVDDQYVGYAIQLTLKDPMPSLHKIVVAITKKQIFKLTFLVRCTIQFLFKWFRFRKAVANKF